MSRGPLQGRGLLRAWLSTALIAVITAGLLTAAPLVSAKVVPFEVDAYRQALGVPAAVAEEDLKVQAKGAEADIAGGLEVRLHGDFAGIWFDPKSGEYVVPIASDTVDAIVGKEMAAARLAGDYRTRVVEHSWEELDTAQEQIDSRLREFFEANLIYTSIDPRTNAVVVHVASAANAKDRAPLIQIVKSVGSEVELRASNDDRFEGVRTACATVVQNCGAPFRGGVEIGPWQKPQPGGDCTAGFRALGNTNGKRYVITAGHCAMKDLVNPNPNDPIVHWQAWDEKEPPGPPKYLGTVEQLSFPAHDWMKINATGTEWDTWNTPQGWPAMVAYWQKDNVEPPINTEYPIIGESSSITGQSVCHSGIASGGSCGQVVATNVTYDFGPSNGQDLVKVEGACNMGGDSGGPWFAANIAYGIHIGSEDGFSPCNVPAYYHEITEVTDALGVTIASRVPEVTIAATPLNGNPGWVTAKGSVTVPGMTIINKDITIKLFKWNNASAQWDEKASLPAKVNNGAYEFTNWNGVGPGTWIAKAVFPAQGGLLEATSDVVTEGHFTVKDGYRIVSKNSEKCLDVVAANKESGALIQQWDCLNPALYQNQVFTLVPDNGYVRLVPRHSGRCLDVTAGSPNNGALLQQYTCQANYSNQLWQTVPSGGEYFELRPKHSNKCMDVAGGSKGNGATVWQWTCNGFPQQKWFFQSVDSAPIPTETHVTVPAHELLDGSPGYATVQGYVKTGAYGVGGQQVTIHYEKGGIHEKRQATLNSEGFYQRRYEGLGSGTWYIWTEFKGANNLAPSSSPAHKTEIRIGYRFVFRHSGKCLSKASNPPDQWANGLGMIQWDCSPTPNNGDGQVFSIKPFDNGAYFQIEINSTDKCIDIAGASTGNGAWLQQWDCGDPPPWRKWQVVPIQNWEGWYAFKSQHSGKCMDVIGGSTANGIRVQQWDCTWVPQQQWHFQAIN